MLKLSGIAQKAGKRTAIISGDGQVYLVGEGDSVAGRYTVVTIDPEAVLLRDAAVPSSGSSCRSSRKYYKA